MKTVLVIGSGGREHAIVLALSRSEQVGKIYCAPGNAGIGEIATLVPIKDTDVKALRDFALENDVDLTVVGPEASLAEGVVDVFRRSGLAIVGHSRKATRIETSKEFAKKLMKKYGIPTSKYRSFSDYDKALAYVKSRPFPAVLKYDGLAAGKGVVIAQDLAQAEQALSDMLLDKSFGKAKVVVEDYLEGPEFSFMCFVRNGHISPMPASQDHKRAYDGDMGPNTGGMGAYTALPFLTKKDIAFAKKEILQKTADAMLAEGCPLTGILYGGLMKTKDGIKVIEFNARFGDPETEVVLPLLDSDIYDMFISIATGRGRLPATEWSDDVTMGVVMASKGYPGKYSKGQVIEGLENVQGTVIHMGTSRDGQGQIITGGGRVLMCVSRSKDIAAAKEATYGDISRIKCDNLFYRKDIAHQAFKK